jgi:hypothetical protein
MYTFRRGGGGDGGGGGDYGVRGSRRGREPDKKRRNVMFRDLFPSSVCASPRCSVGLFLPGTSSQVFSRVTTTTGKFMPFHKKKKKNNKKGRKK